MAVSWLGHLAEHESPGDVGVLVGLLQAELELIGQGAVEVPGHAVAQQLPVLLLIEGDAGAEVLLVDELALADGLADAAQVLALVLEELGDVVVVDAAGGGDDGGW